MTAYRMTRTVHLEDDEELHAWWQQSADHEEDYYTEDAALQLLLSDEYLSPLELAAMGVVSFGEVSVEREEEG